MRLLVILIVLFTALPAEGQRYLAGMRGVQAMGGLIERNGYYLHGGYSWYTESKNRWAGDVEYLHQRHAWEAGDIPLAQFTAEFGFYRLLFCDVSKSFFVAIGVTALTGYETVNWSKKQLPSGAVITNADKWLYGAAAAVEVEYYLDDRYIFLLTAKQRMAGGSSVGMFHTLFGVGVKYILE
ncbi:MAG: conjugal transfer protein TraO [Prevotellaceae bacterium]|nr:conjugal transfer protein TraO [Prevotellaceae bacterium]